jgi:hypothetical protein
MFESMVLAGVVGLVEDAFTPKVLESTLGIMAFQPVKTLIHGFEALPVMVPMVRSCGVMLLVVIGVGLAWFCPNSLRVVRRGAAILQP